MIMEDKSSYFGPFMYKGKEMIMEINLRISALDFNHGKKYRRFRRQQARDRHRHPSSHRVQKGRKARFS